jgi:ABC-type amino acid transport substrate-binding protein
VLPVTFERQLYAIALPAGSPLREPLNRALLARTTSPDWARLVSTYLGEAR